MKTKAVFITVFFLLAIFILVSCREEDPPKLEVEVKPTSVVYKGSAILSWRGENLALLKINGIKQSDPNNGLINLYNLTENKAYNFVGLGLDGSTVSRDVSIEVIKPAPELTVLVSPNTVVPYKGSATLFWSGRYLTSLKINDVNRPDDLSSGVIRLTNLLADTTFNFVATGLDGSTVTKSALVNVAKPTKLDTMMALLCNRPWRVHDVSEYTMEGEFIYSSDLGEWITSDLYYWYPDGSRAVDRTAQGKGWERSPPNDWSFSPDGTHYDTMGKKTYDRRFTLTSDFFKLFYKSSILNATTGESRPTMQIHTYKAVVL